MTNAIGVSIHNVNNKTDKWDYRPIWLTLTDEKEVKKTGTWFGLRPEQDEWKERPLCPRFLET